MNKKYLILPIITVALLGSGSALAFGGGWFGGNNFSTSEELVAKHQEMFEKQSQLLGISVPELKNFWAEGKTMKEIMEAKGINQEQFQAKMKETRLQEMKTHLQTLVDKGVITKEQADKRIETMQNKTNFGKMGKMSKGGNMGFGVGCSK